LDYFHVDQFIASDSSPITYYVDAGNNWNQLYLPGESTEWEDGTTTDGYTFYFHEASGATVYVKGVDPSDVIYVGYGEDAAERSKHVTNNENYFFMTI
jgi:hypothetical protein